jgi:hypothetical protein
MIILKRNSIDAEVSTRLGIDGHFRLVKSRADGTVTQILEFENLLLDAGLNRLGTDNGVAFCAIGTGTGVPTATETALQAQQASTSTVLPGAATTAGGSSPYWTGYTFGFRFPIGSLSGNYSEIGVGWSAILMSSRALILDIGGSPTTITVTSAEQLDVFYTRRVYPPLVDVTASSTIGGVSTTVTTRAHSAGSTTLWDASSWPRYDPSPASNGSFLEAYSGAAGAITGLPSGTPSSGSSGATLTYSNNSLSRSVAATYNLSQANFVGGVASTVCWFRMMAFQYGFSPAIAKTASNTLALTYSVTWARRP